MAVTGAARMARRLGVLAWGLWALVMLGLAVVPWMDSRLRQAGRPDLASLVPGNVVGPVVAMLSAATVGALLASRRPRHPVGWLLLGFALSLTASGVTSSSVTYGLVARPGALPAANVAARLYPVTIAAALAVVGFVLLLTPTGSPPSSRWRRWPWALAVAVAVVLVAATVAPGSLDPLAQFVSGAMDPQVYSGALRVAVQLALLAGLLTVLAGAGSLVARFRRARGVERLQLQWVALAAGLTGLSLLAAAVLIAVGEVNLSNWASAFGVAFLPLATGAAILRYRLYDLDRIISRTLAYGLLTVLLGLGYAAVVLGFGRLLGRESPLVVAAATLAVAAVFQPARRRVQAVVDRRFNRRRHDAARIIEGFGTRLRDQVDLDTLTAEVLAVAEQTMQPTQASLWLRPQAPSGTAGVTMAQQRT
jgi:hypothetical protein